MARSSRARPAEGFYEELLLDLETDDSDDLLDTLSDSSDDEYVIDEREGLNEPLHDRYTQLFFVRVMQ